AIVTLALAIGVNAAAFTVIDAVAFKPIPVSDPRSTVRLGRLYKFHYPGSANYAFSYPEYAFLRDRTQDLSDLVAASQLAPIPEDRNGLGAVTQVQFVSANFFSALAPAVQMGRAFAADEARLPAGTPVVVLSEPFWRHRFHSDLSVINKTIVLNHTPLTVIGVAPADFIGIGNPPLVPDAWAPLPLMAGLTGWPVNLRDSDEYLFQLMGRLKPGTSRATAAAGMALLFTDWLRLSPPDTTRVPVTEGLVLTLPHYLEGIPDIRAAAAVTVVMVTVGLVLLIACANLAGLALARATARHREFAIRLALGAGRARVTRQLLTEQTVLALVGGALGVGMALWGCNLLRIMALRLLPIIAPEYTATVTIDLSPDARILAFALGLSVFAAILVSLLPVLNATRQDMGQALKRSDTALGHQGSRFRGLLVAAQVAGCVALLLATGLLVRGMLRSSGATPGFDAQHLLMVSVNPPDSMPPAAFDRALVDRLTAIPGVRSVAMTTFPSGNMTPIAIPTSESRATIPDKAMYSVVSPTFFTTAGIPLVLGRGFTDAEASAQLRVMVVSEETGRRLWPGQDPIGKHVVTNCPWCQNVASGATPWEVIGVARDVRSNSITRIDPTQLYVPAWGNGTRGMSALVQANGDAPRARAIIAAIGAIRPNAEANVSVARVSDALKQSQLATDLGARVATVVTAVLGGFALALASIGIAGVIAYTVARRKREIGIRIALGAQPWQVLRLVLGQGLRPAAIGVAAGLAGAAAIGSILSATTLVNAAEDIPDLLYGASVIDPLALGGVTLLVVLITSTAAYFPASKALKVDPMAALREE
ncbi:MAG TPA: ADOP family duplicated permease, partial [Gemmatimonadales bacterium]